MTKKFKDYYDGKTARLLGEKIASVAPSFAVEEFVSLIKQGIKGKEFLERQDVFASALGEVMGSNYSKNLKVLTKILGPELSTETGMFTHGYWLWPIGRYVEINGTKDFEVSIVFIYELTKRFTGEFAIRPLLEMKPKATMKIILKWSRDENVHVRRLAAESARIHLPWAKKSTVCLDEFATYKKILTNLKSDKSKFVQKSVGNNLNDLYRFNKDKAEGIIKEWESGEVTLETAWIIKHGTRSLRKVKN